MKVAHVVEREDCWHCHAKRPLPDVLVTIVPVPGAKPDAEVKRLDGGYDIGLCEECIDAMGVGRGSASPATCGSSARGRVPTAKRTRRSSSRSCAWKGRSTWPWPGRGRRSVRTAACDGRRSPRRRDAGARSAMPAAVTRDKHSGARGRPCDAPPLRVGFSQGRRPGRRARTDDVRPMISAFPWQQRASRPSAGAYRFVRPLGFFGAPQMPPPPTRVTPFTGPGHTLRVMEEKALGPRGEQSILVRQFAEEIVRHLEPKDYLGEILAVKNVFLQRSPQTGAPLFRYMNDPLHVELVKDPERMVEEIKQYGSTTCDCDEITLLGGTLCLVLGREVEWVALGFHPGQLSHVGVRVREPKSQRWLWLDPVAGPRERDAAATAKNTIFWSLE